MAGQATGHRVQRQFGHVDRLGRIAAVGGEAEGDRIARHVADHPLKGGVAAVQAGEVGGGGCAQRLTAFLDGEVGANGGGPGDRHVRQFGEVGYVESHLGANSLAPLLDEGGGRGGPGGGVRPQVIDADFAGAGRDHGIAGDLDLGARHLRHARVAGHGRVGQAAVQRHGYRRAGLIQRTRGYGAELQGGAVHRRLNGVDPVGGEVGGDRRSVDRTGGFAR